MTYTENPSSLVDTKVINCGANLEQVEKLPDKCIDLVYIDPPADSDGTFKEFWKEWLEKLAFKDCLESTQAYMDFMRPRCVELARVLKPTGCFYFHCDWNAKQYFKVMLDQVLGNNNFIDEVIWRRNSDHNDAVHGSKRLGRVHGTLLIYSGDSNSYYKHLYRPDDVDYSDKLYRKVEPETGRRYRYGDLGSQRIAAPSNPEYEFLGVARSWRYSKEDMQKLLERGRIIQEGPGAEPHIKLYLDEIAGVPVGSVWDNIEPLHSHDEERLGYPTKEPLRLLEKVLEIALQANDDDLDECGCCGTAVVAALNTAQQQIGVGHFMNVPPRQNKLTPVGGSTAAA